MLIFIPWIAWYVYSANRRYAQMSVSSTRPFLNKKRPFKLYLIHFLFVLRLLTVAALIVVIARPQIIDTEHGRSSTTNGTDIVIALDISSSMLAEDFSPNRLEVAKEMVAQFANKRENDNIGLVIFAGESYTAVPLTTDHAQLINELNEVEIGLLDDATAIGDGLATAVNRLQMSQAKSKSIILVTDGAHNAGQLSPEDASDIAKEKDIKIYTIGIGTDGEAPYTQYDQFGRAYRTKIPVTIDERTLRAIASKTNGKYFRAKQGYQLGEVFAEIDKLETSEIQTSQWTSVTTDEDYQIWAFIALCILVFEMLLNYLIIRQIP